MLDKEKIFKKNIGILSCFEAPYGGNFICMIKALTLKLIKDYKCKVCLIFPNQSDKDWLQELKSLCSVEFTTKPYKRSTDDLLKIILKYNLQLVHTHFEGYDVPVAKAIQKSGLNVKQIWHLHDNITLEKKGLSMPFIRKIKTNIDFYIHYGFWGKNAYFISVSQEVAIIENHYRRLSLRFPPENISIKDMFNYKLERCEVVINGIDINRLKTVTCNKNGEFTFMTFGGHTYRKGIPTIISAAELLYSKGFNFILIITKGIGTEKYINDRYEGKIPLWIKLIDQNNDVSKLYSLCDCFISASLKETMSMALAEASILEIPTIQSDIPGTYWNAKNPSTYLFEVNNYVDLYNKMKEILLCDKIELKDRAKKTAVINKKNLSLENWCNKIIDIYNKNL